MYTITKNFIPGLPRTPYNDGVGAYIGVVGHSTANPGDSDISERNWEAKDWQNAFAHFFVDDTGILQVADTNYICYGAGQTANHSGYVQVELCETSDPVKFQKAYGAYVWLMAKLLYDKKLPVIDGKTLMSHQEVSSYWHETDHQDPIAYLASHGKTWQNVVDDVAAQYNAMKGVVSMTVIDFQKEYGLTPDGIAGPITIAKMLEVAAKYDALKQDITALTTKYK
jgi:N-acetylmuramoyl-L-alanine amidase CwlA